MKKGTCFKVKLGITISQYLVLDQTVTCYTASMCHSFFSLSLSLAFQLPCLNDEPKRRKVSLFAQDSIDANQRLFISQLEHGSSLAHLERIVARNLLSCLIHEKDPRDCVALLVVGLGISDRFWPTQIYRHLVVMDSIFVCEDGRRYSI